MTPLLEVKQLSKSYFDNMRALSDVSFTISEGECLGLVGESGSGKSTLARLILGLLFRTRVRSFCMALPSTL